MTDLDYIATKHDNSELIQFIDEFNPCETPCNLEQEDTVCTMAIWGDGICHADCFRKECNFDNGDCAQMCTCNSSILGNGICDDECNNEYCHYDYFDCIDTNGTCYKEVNDSNNTYTCYNEWILTNDLWCDENCKSKSECNYDNDICSECEGNCFNILAYAMALVGSTYPPANVLTEIEICENWVIITYVLYVLYVYMFVDCYIIHIDNRIFLYIHIIIDIEG